MTVVFELAGTYTAGFVYSVSAGALPILNNCVPFVNGGDGIVLNGSFVFNLTTAGTFVLRSFIANALSNPQPFGKGLYITRLA